MHLPAGLPAVLALAAALLPAPAPADGPRWIVLGPLPPQRRLPLAADPVLARVLGGDAPRWPAEGEEWGGLRWSAAVPGPDGALSGPALENGWAYGTLESDRERVVLAAAPGAASLWVNGEPFVGDVYRQGSFRVPVLLRRGTNHLLARSPRGGFALRLEDPPGPVVLDAADATLPDLVEGLEGPLDAAIPVLNCTAAPLPAGSLRCGRDVRLVPPLPPLGVAKVRFEAEGGPDVEIAYTAGGTRARATIDLRRRKKGEVFRATFVSRVDQSVQYYAVLPGTGKGGAIILSLHGAGVEATGQAAAYAPKDWATVVCPTNRRPFGFDWEDWGRLDALEVLQESPLRLHLDAGRVHLTGHSMGGHGAWQLAALYPDLWASAAPSAGWLSFDTYGPGPAGAKGAEAAFRRAAATSDTPALFPNLKDLPLFLIHGDADDDVPVGQSRRAVEELKKFHQDFRFHEVKGGKHWWDDPKTPGTDCVDLPALQEFWRGRRRKEDVPAFEFRTFSPAVSSRCRTIEVLSQGRPLEMSRVEARGGSEGLVLRTENVLHLRVRGDRDGDARPVTVDGAPFAFPRLGPHSGPPHLEVFREGGKWRAGGPPAGTWKSPDRYGPLKQVFFRPFVLVPGTLGDEAEDRALLARARYDAEVFWYRGNGYAPVVEDGALSGARGAGENLVLYGNEASNACWNRLAGRLPFRVLPGELRLRLPEGADPPAPGDRLAPLGTERGWKVLEGDFAFAAVYPDPDDRNRLVGFVGSTGPAGRRAWHAASLFTSGASFPDLAVWDATVFEKGLDAVLVAGFFGPDWQADPLSWISR